MDTIFALASAPGRAGVSVIRISGPEAHLAVRTLTGSDVPLRRAVLRKLTDRQGEHLDTALVLAFPDNGSFTGEAVVELHLHGSVATVSAVLGELGGMPGLRIADRGEFTRRALENDRLDLAQVEGLADLIDAETESQRRQALKVLSGALGDAAASWRRRLVRALALIDASIDFADEELPEDMSEEVFSLLADVRAELEREIAGARVAERIREGFEVAIVGAPNVGKSTLLNAFAGREAAITSEVAGTTRDVIEVRMDLAGLPVTLLDTAGLRETEDRVERIGVALARRRAEAADLRVFMVTGEAPDPAFPPRPGDIVVWGKSDLGHGRGLSVSGLTGAGMDSLVDEIAARLSDMSAGSATAMRARQRLAIERCLSYISEAESVLRSGSDRGELVAEAIQGALRSLDVLVGRVDVEEVLDVIFSSFCLGK